MNLTLHIGWPQGIMLALIATALLVHGINHGKPRSAHHFGWQFLGMTIELLLLWWGGFFG